VKFLVDAQLPVRLANFLNRAGHQAIHTSDLSNGNASTDAHVVEIADAESRVVITKDRDFRDSHPPMHTSFCVTGVCSPIR
jgi:predicted nuclease of predicted toxin-antitoxin system